jgi:uncharacterized protein
MSTQIPVFQRYQLAFTAHLRDPQRYPAPAGVPSERMAVYDEIVFNNLLQSVSACFPVASAVLGKRKWRKLVQRFMRHYSANSPFFRDIPKQFLEFLQTDLNTQDAELKAIALPPYINALCHYEWIELYVSAHPAEVKAINASKALDLAANMPVFNPTLQLLQYDYAVHKISARKKVVQPTPTQLVVYRNLQNVVKFVEMNAVTYQLIALMQSEKLTGAKALLLLAQQLGHPEPQIIMQFGLAILEELRAQEIIIGAEVWHD